MMKLFWNMLKININYFSGKFYVSYWTKRLPLWIFWMYIRWEQKTKMRNRQIKMFFVHYGEFKKSTRRLSRESTCTSIAQLNSEWSYMVPIRSYMIRIALPRLYIHTLVCTRIHEFEKPNKNRILIEWKKCVFGVSLAFTHTSHSKRVPCIYSLKLQKQSKN